MNDWFYDVSVRDESRPVSANTLNDWLHDVSERDKSRPVSANTLNDWPHDVSERDKSRPYDIVAVSSYGYKTSMLKVEFHLSFFLTNTSSSLAYLPTTSLLVVNTGNMRLFCNVMCINSLGGFIDFTILFDACFLCKSIEIGWQ